MTKTLIDILSGVKISEKPANFNETTPITSVVFDSRKVVPGSLFVAISGEKANGHDYLKMAEEKGAAALLVQQPEAARGLSLPWVAVNDSQEALGICAANYFDHPSDRLKLVGITGTNGKTTCATLLYQLFMQTGHPCGLISTVENRIGEAVIPATHTTPDPVSLQHLLAKMVENGCEYAFMEVSSHAIEQRRIAGLRFEGAVFTNLTHDHLDYHKTFAVYRDVKKQFFDHLPKTAFALVNVDDKNGKFMLQNTAASTYTYGLKKSATYKAKITENSLDGLHLHFDGQDFHARMIGEFNAYNLLAVYGSARLLGLDALSTLTVLSNLRGAEGRFDYTIGAQSGTIGIVDYAHTPDALENVLETIELLKKRNSKVFTVTGCGGDRDKTKRPKMASICAKKSHLLIMTSDNPRTENPDAILRDMENGLTPEEQKQALTIADREQAIKTACQLAGKDDIILVAGKGHEKYQEIDGIKHPFDDKAMLIKYLH